jgi:hypothetical protein
LSADKPPVFIFQEMAFFFDIDLHGLFTISQVNFSSDTNPPVKLPTIDFVFYLHYHKCPKDESKGYCQWPTAGLSFESFLQYVPPGHVFKLKWKI